MAQGVPGYREMRPGEMRCDPEETPLFAAVQGSAGRKAASSAPFLTGPPWHCLNIELKVAASAGSEPRHPTLPDRAAPSVGHSPFLGLAALQVVGPGISRIGQVVRNA